MYNDANRQHELNESCLECGASDVVEVQRNQQFAFGPPEKQVMLNASMPVLLCRSCGYESFDERGEAARQEAVCKHMGVYGPSQVRAIREATGLRRMQFCEITGFGSASLQRWESGAIVPNTSTDRLIHLLQYPENVERLKRRHE